MFVPDYASLQRAVAAAMAAAEAEESGQAAHSPLSDDRHEMLEIKRIVQQAAAAANSLTPSSSSSKQSSSTFSASSPSAHPPGSIFVPSLDYRYDPSPAAPTFLPRVSLDIRPGSFVVCVGAVASGKTTLLLALLGEMQTTTSSQRVSSVHAEAKNGSDNDLHYSALPISKLHDIQQQQHQHQHPQQQQHQHEHPHQESPHASIFRQTLFGRVALVAQQSWIVNDTVRGNICFGRAFDAEWYAAVVDACALTADLRHDLGGCGGVRLWVQRDGRDGEGQSSAIQLIARYI
jgi:ABC-type transport system involved in cytochrome bd biosynthesis fused ATPase/permease subunit